MNNSIPIDNQGLMPMVTSCQDLDTVSHDVPHDAHIQMYMCTKIYTDVHHVETHETVVSHNITCTVGVTCTMFFGGAVVCTRMLIYMFAHSISLRNP